jgi:hypothetical protein
VPWKLPFRIEVEGNGEAVVNTHWKPSARGPEYDTTYTLSTFEDSVSIWLDTTDAYKNDSVRYSLKDDTLRFSRLYLDTFDSIRGFFPSVLDSVTICFEPNHDSIFTINVFEISSGIKYNLFSYPEIEYKIYRFNIAFLAFDSDSILLSDSFFQGHHIAFSTIETDNVEYPTMWQINYKNVDFNATSVTLSGIFRTTTFSEPPAIVTAPPSNNLTVFNSNGSIACSFDQSEHERNLEIYSPLGVKVASEVIPPNENSVFLSRLSPGFYFVRLEGDVRKLYIPY